MTISLRAMRLTIFIVFVAAGLTPLLAISATALARQVLSHSISCSEAERTTDQKHNCYIGHRIKIP
jgi:hypothetical protein